jgi:hypothetical protein
MKWYLKFIIGSNSTSKSARAARIDDFDFLETIDLTDDRPSGKRRCTVETTNTLKAKEPITPTPTQSTRPPSLSATLETPQMTRKRINDQYDLELLDLELEMKRRKIEIARREALKKAGLDTG